MGGIIKNSWSKRKQERRERQQRIGGTNRKANSKMMNLNTHLFVVLLSIEQMLPLKEKDFQMKYKETKSS